MSDKISDVSLSETMWTYEVQLATPVTCFAGVDEAGRGALAGPVVAAAVILGSTPSEWVGVFDSKQLSKKRREAMSRKIRDDALAVAVGIASPSEIDELNILYASRLAMARAIALLPTAPELVLVDGPYPPLYIGATIPSIPVVDGDAKCLSVAAASIVAKVERDNIMLQLHERYPEYQFLRNMGYPTREHISSLEEYGPTEIHRMTFGPVQRVRQARLDLTW